MQRKIISLIITAALSCGSVFASASLHPSPSAATASKGTTVSVRASSAEGSQVKTAATISAGSSNAVNSSPSSCKVTASSKQAAASCSPSTACGNGQCNSAACSSQITCKPSCPQTSSKPSCPQSTSKPTVSQTPSKPASSQAASSSPSAASYTAFQNEVVRLVNVERVKNSLPALTADTLLMKTATIKSQDMVSNNYFSHTSPTYGSPFDLMKQYGVTYRAAGENIAMGQTSPAEVMNGWMNSPGHRANILNASFTKIGVGVVKNASGQYYWTQHFTG